MHPLLPVARIKVYDSAIGKVCGNRPGFLSKFPQHAGLRSFPRLNLAADSNPFPLIHIVRLFDTMEH